MYEKPKTPQFRATKMWNNLVQNFRSSIKLKKKRHFFKTYQNCFSSSDAISCMLNILQQQSSSNNSSSVTRTQAITILQSLYNANIFSDIKDNSNRTDANDPRQFLDNNKIFKLLPQTDENIFPTVTTTFDDNKSIATNDETKTSFSPSSVFELMYAFARQKRKLNSISLFKP